MTATPDPPKADDDGAQAVAANWASMPNVMLQLLTTEIDWSPLDDLADTIQRTADAAIQAQLHPGGRNAGQPSSAAVMNADGEVVQAFSIEGDPDDQTTCTARVAMFAASTRSSHIVALAICAPAAQPEPTFPCDKCLDVALKAGGVDLLIAATNQRGSLRQTSAGELWAERYGHNSTPT